ncbi:MAG: M13 family metallopeptidase [Alphaproteobacteria bacterium]|nr:M13 family metallopeptidase [Alphaproteobacteria bacterium]MBV9692745.1 M13 family metallopeptidase [Alphaproteobacteria bacterium]
MNRLHIVAAALLAATAAIAAPQYGRWGFDSAGMDAATRPGDDFFRFANGAWLDRTQIPGDKPGVSFRLQMTDRAEARIHDLLEAAKDKAPNDLEGKVGRFYRSFMDEARVDAAGAKPLDPLFADVRNAKSRDALAALMGRSAADFEGTLFNFGIDADLKDPKHYAVYIGQGGLGLPDRDYYLKPQFAAQKAKYQDYVAQLLKLAGWQGDAKAVVDFETKVADASWAKADQRDPVKVYNPTTIAELEKLAPGFNWKGFLADADLSKVGRVIVAEKTAFPKLAAIFAATPVATLQAWQAFHIADNAAPYLSKPFTDAYFEMHDKTLSGQKEQKLRWKRAVLAVSGSDFLVGDRFGSFGTMGWGVGQLYAAKYFPPAAKAKIEALVGNLKAAYRVRLEHLDWMSEPTRQQALKKLDTYTIKVGYPDHPRDYSALIIGDDLVGNVRRAGAADWAFYSGRLFGPVDRSDWAMTPQTNDAYNGTLRDIAFPAGILQAPMFDAEADPAINYGAIGGVIGHELTHGFDDQGRKIDADGALRDWWTKEDADKFEARAKALGAQYSAFQPLPGVHVNGDLTMGENIADLGGLTLALDAYHASLGGKPAPVIDSLTGDQRVFLGWAQAWRGKVTDDYVKKQVVSDPHSPRQFRVNGVVRNLDAWYAAFAIKPGDKLYVAPEKRVRIW